MATILNSCLADLFDYILDRDHTLHMATQQTAPYSPQRAAAAKAVDYNKLLGLQSAAIAEARQRGGGDSVHVFPMIQSLVSAFKALCETSVGSEFKSERLITARTRFIETWDTLNPYVPRGDSSQVKAPAAGVSIESEIERYALAMGDEIWGKIMIIAERQNLSGEQKMRLIGELDHRTKSWKSTQWATLLKVDSAAVRGYATWKEWREFR